MGSTKEDKSVPAVFTFIKSKRVLAHKVEACVACFERRHSCSALKLASRIKDIVGCKFIII